MKNIKVGCFLALLAIGIAGAFTNSGFVLKTSSLSSGPPAGFSGAPEELDCAACHSGPALNGQFAILDAPVNYNPGQTYQIRVRHSNSDQSRRRWGFQMSSYAGANGVGLFSNLNTNTQVLSESGRSYVEHTSAGTFAGQFNSAEWTFNWTAPSTNVGQVTLYAAGIQANQAMGPDGDQPYLTNISIAAPRPAAFDLDGDRKTDVAIFRPAPAEAGNTCRAAACCAAGSRRK